MKKRALAVLLALAFPGSAFAQVLITEVQPDPTSTNDDGEWVEIQNTGSAPVAIDGWTLNDYASASDPAGEAGTRWAFPAGTTLAAGQVIVVARYASATGYADNTPAALFAAPPTFELGSATHDDAAVPNLTPSGGTSVIQLSNATTGDAVVLKDAMGAVVSGVEWGSLDRTVPGMPAMSPGAGASLRRVSNTGSSATDFTVAVTPDPFTGYTGGPPAMGPLIVGTTLVPRHVTHGDTVVVSSTVTDMDGVMSVELLTAAATSSTGAASSGFTSTPMNAGASNSFSATANPSSGAAPATFHERYLRSFVRATDATNQTSTDPNAAITAAGNTHYYFRNVMPVGASPISEARAQLGNGPPMWSQHSVRVEGVALTNVQAFVANRTNFFIMSQTSPDAIRVFGNTLIPQNIRPGDIVRVVGMIDSFNGLRQVGDPELSVSVIGSGGAVTATQHTIADLNQNGEQLESQLVYIAGASLVMPAANWPTNGNVDIEDGTGTITVRVSSITDLSGMPAPQQQFDIRGILGQFAANGAGGYQVLPRDMNDVMPGTVRPDGGMGGQDGGGGGGDSGVVPDSGTTMMDSGTTMTDSGTIVDSGMRFDAGMNADTGGVHADSGMMEDDSGVTGDQDTGIKPDAGRRGSGGTTDNGGCSCAAAEQNGSRSGASFAIAALIGALVIARRRR